MGLRSKSNFFTGEEPMRTDMQIYIYIFIFIFIFIYIYMSYSLNSLKGGYIGDYIGDHYRGY